MEINKVLIGIITIISFIIVIFLDIINNLERIADHCSNIGLAVEQVKSANNSDFDSHAYLKYVHDNKSPEYTAVYDKYIEKYAVK